jgi:hypothetical protein
MGMRTVRDQRLGSAVEEGDGGGVDRDAPSSTSTRDVPSLAERFGRRTPVRAVSAVLAVLAGSAEARHRRGDRRGGRRVTGLRCEPSPDVRPAPWRA